MVAGLLQGCSLWMSVWIPRPMRCILSILATPGEVSSGVGCCRAAAVRLLLQ